MLKLILQWIRGRRFRRSLPREPDHFVDPIDAAGGCAECGASLAAPGHPFKVTVGAPSTYHRHLVTCTACRQQEGLD